MYDKYIKNARKVFFERNGKPNTILCDMLDESQSQLYKEKY